MDVRQYGLLKADDTLDDRHVAEVIRDAQGMVAGVTVKHTDDDSVCAVGDMLAIVGIEHDDTHGPVIMALCVFDSGVAVLGIAEATERHVIE